MGQYFSEFNQQPLVEYIVILYVIPKIISKVWLIQTTLDTVLRNGWVNVGRFGFGFGISFFVTFMPIVANS